MPGVKVGASLRLADMALVAALVETALLRFLLRLGPLLSPTPAVRAWGQVGMVAGTAALNLAYLLSTVALLRESWRAARGLRRRQRLAGGLLLGAMALGLAGDAANLTGLGTLPMPALLAFQALALAALVAWAACAAGSASRQALLWVICAAYGVAALSVMRPLTLGLLPWSAGANVSAVAEGLAVVGALLTLPLGRPEVSLRAAVVATLGVLLLAGMALGRSWLPAAFAVWNFGFTLFLPFWLYAVALWFYVYTAAACWASGKSGDRRMALGLILVALGGLRPDYSYMQRLALLGLWEIGAHGME